MTRQIKFIPPLQVSIPGPVAVTGTFTSTGIKPIKNPVTTDVITSGAADTETSFVLTTIKKFILINRGSVVIKFSYQLGQSGTVYASINPGGFNEEVNIDDQTITFYIQAPSASQRLEVISWS